MAAEAKGIGKGDFNRGMAGYMGYIIQIAFGIGVGEIYRWRYDAILYSLYAYSRLDSTGTTYQVACH